MTIPSSAPPHAASIPPAATPSPPVPERTPLPGLFQGLDGLLIGLVLLFTFLASSFVIRNSDFWFHLASGRLLVHGQYVFGVDPFCCTTEGVYWTNHSWLYDGLLYLLHDRIGAAGLVVLKALLLTLLVALLIHVRLPGGCRAISAGCTALALLASSAQLTLQPVCLSYVLLGVLLWLLWRYQHRPRPQEPPSFRQELSRLGGVLGLLVLWVNVDAWFLMGLFVIALFWVGSWFDPRVSCPGWLFPLSVAVCLVNPHHFHVFTWPAELSSVLWTSGLRLDPRFQGQFVSPWMVGAHFQPAAAVSLGQWAFFTLVLLGMLSFVLVSHNLSGWRSTVWLGLVVIGSWQVGLTPFFAVAAAPITAMNFQQWLEERGRLRQAPALLGRLALLVGVLALLVFTWRGWLHGFHDHGRRIAWGVQPNPSLERAGQQLARWSEQGKLPGDAHIFTMLPEAAHYLAWLAPGQKSFLDHRTPLFRQSARDFEVVCRALDPGLLPSANPVPDQQVLERIFRTYGVSCVLVYDPLLDRVLETQRRLVSDPRSWTLLDVDGLAILHGWSQGNSERYAALAFRPEHKAFAEDQDEDALWTAPAAGPADMAPPPSPWRLPGTLDSEPSWESAAAAVCLETQDEQARHPSRQAQQRERAVHLATLASLPALSADMLGTWTALEVRQVFAGGPYLYENAGPSTALLLLAVRAARRALKDDPQDLNARIRLAEAYLAMRTRSGGPFREPTGSLLDRLRTFQLATALENALRIQPAQESRHHLLAELYMQQKYFDIALLHQRATVRLLRSAGPSEALASAEQRQDMLEKIVEERQQQLQQQAAALGDEPLARARLALHLGLPRQSLEDILLPSGPTLPGTPGHQLELQLLLILGRAEQARHRIREHAAASAEAGALAALSPDDAWLRICVAAACGDYEEADSLLRAQLKPSALLRKRKQGVQRQLLAGLVRVIAVNAQRRPFFPEIAQQVLRERLATWQTTAILQREQVDLAEVAALLALEHGKPAVARTWMLQAIDLLRTGVLPAEQPDRRRLAQAYLHLLDTARSAPPQ